MGVRASWRKPRQNFSPLFCFPSMLLIQNSPIVSKYTNVLWMLMSSILISSGILLTSGFFFFLYIQCTKRNHLACDIITLDPGQCLSKARIKQPEREHDSVLMLWPHMHASRHTTIVHLLNVFSFKFNLYLSAWQWNVGNKLLVH